MEELIKPSYYFDEFFRYVKDYEFTFVSNARERWFGRKLVDLLKTEFQSANEEYYVC